MPRTRRGPSAATASCSISAGCRWTEAIALPIPYITAVVLEEIEHAYAAPPDPDRDRPVPVCIRVGQDHVHGHE